MGFMKKDTYIFISRSGGGKGTQIALLKQYLEDNDKGEVFHLEAGDKFREFIEKKTYSSKLAQKIANCGGLMPSFLAVWAWGGELVDHLTKDNILIIDGIPRKLNEAKLLVEALEFYDRHKVKVVLINVSRDWAMGKMVERHREDDEKLASRKERLEWFESDVLPVIKFFKGNPDYEVIEVNGEQDIKSVHDEVMEKLSL